MVVVMLGPGVTVLPLIALGSPPLKYQDGVQAAQAWFLNSTPAGGTRLLWITDPPTNRHSEPTRGIRSTGCSLFQ